MTERQRQYRVTGFVMFGVATATLLMRIISYFVSSALPASMDEATADLIMDLIFTVPLQIGFLFVMPLLIYKFGLKKTYKEVFVFSNFKRVNVWQVLLSILLGVVSLFATIGISSVWQSILILFGFTPYSSGSALPAVFNFGWMLLAIFLTGILPGFCEEFTNRGGFLSTLRGSFGERQAILLCGLAFGLFHQNIVQFFYPMVFGMVAAYLVLKTGSIIPAMLVHFISNTTSVFLDYADTYNWKFGGGFYDGLNNLLSNQSTLFIVLILFVLSVVLLLFLAKLIPQVGKKKTVEAAKMVSPTRIIYRPTLRDNVWFIAAIAATGLSTIFTWMFGLML